MQKSIALDIGNVCLKLTPERLRDFFGAKENDTFSKEFLASCDKLETGLVTEKEWLKAFRKETKSRYTDDELTDAWNLLLGSETEGLCQLLEKIVNLDYRIIFFSDISKIHLRRVYYKLSIIPLISGGVYSFEVGVKKPDDEMFEVFENFYGKPVLYVDDKPGNIKAGKERDWRGHYFVNVKKLADCFDSIHKLEG